jgi:hypothetical protein
MTVGLSFRLAIHAHDLLPRRVRHAGEDAGFGDRGVALVLQNADNWNMLVPEGFEQQASGLVVADAPGEQARAEGSGNPDAQEQADMTVMLKILDALA